MNINHIAEQAIDARLRAIADKLFGPSRDTLSAVALGDNEVLNAMPRSMCERLQEPRYERTIQIIRNTLSDTQQYVQRPFFDPPARGTAPLERGQIRVVEHVDLNDPSSPRRFTEPALVLLDRHVSTDPAQATAGDQIWQAWTVSQHAAFAGYWDALLQGDDIPDACGMVHVWNLVRVAESHLGHCIYELDLEQQAMVDSLWLEYLSGVQEPDLKGSNLPRWMTAGVRMTAMGTQVVTGSASFGADDPRFMFQRLYTRVREALWSASSANRRAPTLSDIDDLRSDPQPAADMQVAAITQGDKVRLETVLIYANLLQRVQFRGLSDGSLNATAELQARGDSRYVAGTPLEKQADSVWIQWASYSSKDQELALGMLEGLVESLPPGSVAFDFRVGFTPRDEKGIKLCEEFIQVDHQPIQGKLGVFLLSTRQLVAERILAGKVDLDIEIMSDGGVKYLARITIRKPEFAWRLAPGVEQ